MGLWQIFFGDDDSEPIADTVPGGTNTDQSTSTTKSTVIRRTDADGSTRRIIMTNGGNYNKRIDGNHVYNYASNQTKADVEQGNYYEGGTKQEKPTT